MSSYTPSSAKRGYGFKRTGSLLKGRIRDATASRGFAQSKLLTHWEDIAGPNIASISRPVEVSYSKGGIGATLVLLTTGAHAPVLEMEKTKLRDKVNSVYGYNAISRIRITQTAPTGFAEGQVAFAPAPKQSVAPEPNPEVQAQAAKAVGPVQNDDLRVALEKLGAHIISRHRE